MEREEDGPGYFGNKYLALLTYLVSYERRQQSVPSVCLLMSLSLESLVWTRPKEARKTPPLGPWPFTALVPCPFFGALSLWSKIAFHYTQTPRLGQKYIRQRPPSPFCQVNVWKSSSSTSCFESCLELDNYLTPLAHQLCLTSQATLRHLHNIHHYHQTLSATEPA